MNILVINAGSSSLKYQLIDIETNTVVARGLCEKVGGDVPFHKHGLDENEKVIVCDMASHKEAIQIVLETLVDPVEGAIGSLAEITAVGHRIVHGGEYFTESVLIDDDVITKIDECSALAPLHNPPALTCIKSCMNLMPNVPHIAAFDTAFHQTIPPKAYMYPLPYELYEKYKIRKYGFHGNSHRYIANRAAEVLGRPLEELKLITCHLGNGCSLCAIDHGVSVDTSMGFTPLDGLMMGTRCGSIDPAIVTFLMERENLTAAEMNDLMNRKSGLLGISGISNDLREVRDATNEGNERAILAYEMYSHSVKKFIGQYIATMAGVDAIVFTAGVGENCERMRRMILSGLEPIGIVIDHEKNRLRGFERDISAESSRVKTIIIPTNEEYMIARDVEEIVNGLTA